MKILFPPVKNSFGGKGHFLWKLSDELVKNGVDVVFEGDHDFQLGNIRYYYKTPRPKILRVDGVIHNIRKPWQAKNLEMRRNVDISSGVICQSNFGYEMVKRFVGFGDKKVVIINNGADPGYPTRNPNFKHKHNFIAVSKWRPHKRLKDIICSFNEARIKDSALYIIGKITDDTCNWENLIRGNVYHVGHINDREELYGYMKHATAMVHLCWFDCFPNAVVEAVCMKCPVITNNVGGTHEIVRPSGGIVLELDRHYNFEPTDLYLPPPVDHSKVAEAMRKCAEERLVITYNHVDIKKIAKQYIGYFERVLKSIG